MRRWGARVTSRVSGARCGGQQPASAGRAAARGHACGAGSRRPACIPRVFCPEGGPMVQQKTGGAGGRRKQAGRSLARQRDAAAGQHRSTVRSTLCGAAEVGCSSPPGSAVGAARHRAERWRAALGPAACQKHVLSRFTLRTSFWRVKTVARWQYVPGQFQSESRQCHHGRAKDDLAE